MATFAESESSSEDNNSDEFNFEEQLRLEKLEKERLTNLRKNETQTRTDPDGTVYEYDAEKKAWFPKVDEDFMAHYQMSYGVQYDYDSMPVPKQSTSVLSEGDHIPATAEKRKRKKDKNLAALAPQSTSNTWFEVEEDKNTSVYVSNLPQNFTEEEFLELMQKCGLVLLDPFTKKPKLKLYRNSDGTLKGDGRCCYIKRESVTLALQILDGWSIGDGKELKVEQAKFELKGDAYDTSKRKRKLTNKEKRQIKERQEKLFDWRPEKLEIQRGRHERVAIVKFMFTPEQLDADPDFYNDLNDDVKEEGNKAGPVKKITICDRNPEGVVMVHFKSPEDADKCIGSMNGRFYNGKKLEAFTWDGKTKYHIEETDEERAKRLQKWYNFLEAKEEGPKSPEIANESTTGSVVSTDVDAASITTIPPSSDVSLLSSNFSDEQSVDTTVSIAGSDSVGLPSVDNEANGTRKHVARMRNAHGDLSDNSDDDAAFNSTDEEENGE